MDSSITCVQNAFNLVHRASAPVLEECTVRGTAFVPFFPPNVLLIPGTSSVRHLEENMAVADIELDEDTREQLNAVAR